MRKHRVPSAFRAWKGCLKVVALFDMRKHRVQHIPSALMRCRGGRWRDAVVAEHGVHAPLQQRGRPHHISSHAAVREGRVLSSELERKETAESQAAMLRAQKEWKKGTKKFTDQKKQQGSNFQLRPGQWEEIRKIFTQCWPFPSDATTNSPTDVLVVPDGITPRTMVAKVWRHPGVKSMNMFRSHKTIPVVPHKAVAEVSKIGNL